MEKQISEPKSERTLVRIAALFALLSLLSFSLGDTFLWACIALGLGAGSLTAWYFMAVHCVFSLGSLIVDVSAGAAIVSNASFSPSFYQFGDLGIWPLLGLTDILGPIAGSNLYFVVLALVRVFVLFLLFRESSRQAFGFKTEKWYSHGVSIVAAVLVLGGGSLYYRNRISDYATKLKVESPSYESADSNTGDNKKIERTAE